MKERSDLYGIIINFITYVRIGIYSSMFWVYPLTRTNNMYTSDIRNLQVNKETYEKMISKN